MDGRAIERVCASKRANEANARAGIHYRYESDTSVHHRVNDNHCSDGHSISVNALFMAVR